VRPGTKAACGHRPRLPGPYRSPDLDRLDSGTLKVKLLGQPARRTRVTWVAPSGIDLALLRSPSPAGKIQPALWSRGHPVHVGDPAFAVGIPQGLGWTHTQGVVSQFRTMDVGGRRIRVIQTQTALNPGNSGGGLYDGDGYLTGVNTWTNHKRFSEGLGFAIALDSLLDLASPGLAESGSADLAEEP
jgi:hypothetical protein